MTRWSNVTDGELDARLADELRTLSDSARVRPEWARLELLPAVRSRLDRPAPVAPSRLSPVLGLAGAIGAVAVLGVLLLVFFSRPPNTAAPTATPPSATVRQGDFMLTISAGKAVYAPGEPIDVVASLAYDGPDEQVTVAGSFGLIGFGLRQLDGDLELEPGPWPAICLEHEIRRDDLITVDRYLKSGEFQTGTTFDEAFFADEELRLPAGTWEVTAYALFALGGCGGDVQDVRAVHDVRASIQLRVAAADADASAPLEPSPPTAGTRSGDFVLTIRAGKAQYAADEPIDVEALLTYDGAAETVALSGVDHLIQGFSARQLDGPLAMGPGWDEPCVRHELQRFRPVVRSYVKSAGWSPDDPHADFYRAWSSERELRLPPGLWELTAHALLIIGPDCTGEQVTMQVSIELLVGHNPAQPTPTPTSEPAPSDSQAVETGVGGFELSIEAGRSDYVAGEPIDVAAELKYQGPARSTTVCYAPILVNFGYVQLDGELEMTEQVDVPAFNLGYDLRAGEPFRQPAAPLRWLGYDRDDAKAGFYAEWSGSPYLWLPPGTWQISAGSTFGTASGEGCEEVSLSVSIVVEVAEEPVTSPSPTPEFETPSPSPLAAAELACDPLYFTLADRTRIVTSCTTVWPTEIAGDEPRVSNPEGDLGVLDIAWLAQDPRACGPEPPRSTITLWATTRAGEDEPPTPPTYVSWQDVAHAPGTGCRLVASWQGVRLTLSEPVAAADVTFVSGAPARNSARAEAAVGDFELNVESGRGEYVAGEPIDAFSVVSYVGDDQLSLWGYRRGVSFLQLDGDLEMSVGFTLQCDESSVDLSTPHRVEALNLTGYAPDGPHGDFYRDWNDSPFLWLPAGIWRVQAVAFFTLGEHCGGERVQLLASIILRVTEPDRGSLPLPTTTPAPAGEIPLRTSPPNTTGACRMASGGGRLAPHLETGLGVADALGEVGPVVWPFGYTAGREGDRAVLVDPDGRVVAREGDQVRFAGGYGVDDAFYACGAVELGPPAP